MSNPDHAEYRAPRILIFSDLARRGLSHEDIAAGIHSRALRRLRTGVYTVYPNQFSRA